MSQITIDTIDEKLAELKMSKEVSDYSTLLSGFSWTREWFELAEEVLLTLAFRGDSDKPILDFIRARIRETDVRSFNKILSTFDAPPIENHYDYIIGHKRKSVKLSSNGNDAIIDYILSMVNNNSDRTFIDYLSFNQNIRVIKFLIANPEYIVWNNFCEHTNEIAVDYMLKNKDKLAGLNFSSNPNPRMVDYLMKSSFIDSNSFSGNTSDLAVDYLLEHTHNINYSVFSFNDNDKAVRYLIQNPHCIVWDNFQHNGNDLAVDFVIANPDKINWRYFIRNKNPKAAEYLLSNNYDIEYNYIGYYNKVTIDILLANPILTDRPSLSLVNDDRALEYLMANKDKIILGFIISNECNYNMQKLREFNKLRLFPRLPHLVL